MAVGLTDIEFKSLLDEFALRSFSTFEFCEALESRYPRVWREIVEEYGQGGKGAGTHYSAFSRVAHILHVRSERGELDKLDYRDAPPDWGSPIIRYWTLDRAQLGGTLYPDELPDEAGYEEGAKLSVTVNHYERNAEARSKCIEHHGIKCQACGIDFEERYGSHGAGFIHVHHLKPISEIGKTYKVDPVKDLVPVCPNCHAMVHRTAEPLTIEAVRLLIGTHNQS